jgi:HlyD family secretion protein
MTEPQVFEKRLIKTGLSDGINIEVKEGLTEEDKIKVPQS